MKINYVLRGNHLARPQQSGQVLIITAIALLSLLGIAGLATDIGLLWTQKREMQTAADAAAIGAAREMFGPGKAGVIPGGREDAARNGYKQGKDGVKVDINTPPKSGEFSSNDDAVEAIVSQPKPTYFLAALTINSIVVQARAVARATGPTSCIYVTAPSGTSMTLSGSSSVSANCGIVINSDSSSALRISGSACANVTEILIVGGYNSMCTLIPAPVTGVPPATDPLASVPEPIFAAACNYTNYKYPGGGPVTLNPGVYCGGIDISKNGIVNLRPGNYILKGGGLNISSNPTVTGNGVMFYNTEGGGFSYDSITIGSSAKVTLSAPTSGPQAGILFFQDRSIVSNKVNVIASGGSAVTLTGALYFPTTDVKFWGGSSTFASKIVIIARTLDMGGSSSVDINFSVPPALARVTLVE